MAFIGATTTTPAAIALAAALAATAAPTALAALAATAAPTALAAPAAAGTAAVAPVGDPAAVGPPGYFWVWPFVVILLVIALGPILGLTQHWWEHNRNKLLVALALAAVVLVYYGLRGYGVLVHEAAHSPGPQAAELKPAPPPERVAVRTEPGLSTVAAVLRHAVLGEYVPFIILLFSLYVIAGGLLVRGDIRATPRVNTTILAIGGVLASLIGTTGAAMVLIRLLLRTNHERRHKVHTVVFFIFIVANVGGSLLPIGDPPLFLGYLRGVDFFWTLRLWPYWAFMLASLLLIYYVWDRRAWRQEAPADRLIDRLHIEPLRLGGLINLVWLLGVVAAVALLDPAKALPGTPWHAPPYLREGVQLALVVLSLRTTPAALRVANGFNYAAIQEVAFLFIGIFITMQVPIEILQEAGPRMAAAGFVHPWQFFWATGALSSFLDNAPTYVVYFETAGALRPEVALPPLLESVNTASGAISMPLLIAISCGAVFMGANTYIGNGPNFMVKTIAEQAGVRMPTFFGYMAYAVAVLVPLFIVLTLLFFA